jgi:hypothetical protein
MVIADALTSFLPLTRLMAVQSASGEASTDRGFHDSRRLVHARRDCRCLRAKRRAAPETRWRTRHTVGRPDRRAGAHEPATCNSRRTPNRQSATGTGNHATAEPRGRVSPFDVAPTPPSRQAQVVGETHRRIRGGASRLARRSHRPTPVSLLGWVQMDRACGDPGTRGKGHATRDACINLVEVPGAGAFRSSSRDPTVIAAPCLESDIWTSVGRTHLAAVAVAGGDG